jgi:repressor of nif and glnA expression
MLKPLLWKTLTSKALKETTTQANSKFTKQKLNYYQFHIIKSRVRVMVFNATFNNISVISWLSVLLVEETEVPRVNH